jgi:hypothetical protein
VLFSVEVDHNRQCAKACVDFADESIRVVGEFQNLRRNHHQRVLTHRPCCGVLEHSRNIGNTFQERTFNGRRNFIFESPNGSATACGNHSGKLNIGTADLRYLNFQIIRPRDRSADVQQVRQTDLQIQSDGTTGLHGGLHHNLCALNKGADYCGVVLVLGCHADNKWTLYRVLNRGFLAVKQSHLWREHHVRSGIFLKFLNQCLLLRFSECFSEYRLLTFDNFSGRDQLNAARISQLLIRYARQAEFRCLYRGPNHSIREWAVRSLMRRSQKDHFDLNSRIVLRKRMPGWDGSQS